MIRALVWKEVREQGVIVAALGVLGTALLAAIGLTVSSGRDPTDTRTLLTDPGVLAVVMLVVTAGAVVGGTLFAAEMENGTAEYLALLPVRRRGIWAGKMLGGAGLVVAAVAAFYAIAAPLGLLGPTRWLGVWAVGLFTAALASFAWGAVGSVLARSSLAAAGLGALFFTLASLLVLPVVAVVLVPAWSIAAGRLPGLAGGPGELIAGFGLLFSMVVLPVFISLRLYTAPDRDRRRRAIQGTPGRSPRRPSSFRPFAWLGRQTVGVRAALWVSVRQYRVPALIVAGFGLVGGLCLLAPQVPFAAVWPPVSFLLAVLVGVLGWYDEQASGAKRFWLERRLPAGRLWGAKFVVGAAVCGLVTLVALLPVAVKAMAVRRDFLASPSFVLGLPQFPLATYLLLWPAYGFVFGHTLGLVFRKTVVAAAVAVMVGGVAAGVWLPSLLGGGLHWWQPWLPAAGVVMAARGLAWWFAADRIGSRPGLLRVAAGGGLVAALTGVGLGYRVFEIPDDPARGAEVAFRDGQIPRFEDDVARQEIRRGALLLQDTVVGRAAAQEQLARGAAPTPARYTRDDALHGLPYPLTLVLESTLEHGWQQTDEGERLLAAAFATEWAEAFEVAARLPLGTVEDPRDLKLNAPLRYLHALHGADALLLVRGLKAQHEGDPARFVTDFALVLHLSRSVRNKSVQACAAAGRAMEVRAVRGLQRWLERLHGREDLLLRVDGLLAEHDRACGDDRADVRLADQVVLRNTFAAPGEVLRREWHHADTTDDAARARMDTEADLVGFAWQMPWEKERQERLLALGNGVGYGAGVNPWMRRSPFTGLPAVAWLPHTQDSWTAATRGGFTDLDGAVQSDRRAARILIAIRRYELKHGQPPEALAVLQDEKFLSAVPTDPFTNAPFGYRLSAGEQIDVETRTEPPGWSLVSGPGVAYAAVIGSGVATDQRFATATPVVGQAITWSPTVPRGRPVLWGVGPDRRDDGGMATSVLSGRGRDRVYLPPSVPTDMSR